MRKAEVKKILKKARKILDAGWISGEWVRCNVRYTGGEVDEGGAYVPPKVIKDGPCQACALGAVVLAVSPDATGGRE